MLKKDFIISLFAILLYIFTCNMIYTNETKNITTTKIIKEDKISSGHKITINNNIIGKIIIKKINISNYLYNPDSTDNNVNKNITILKESIFPEQDNSIMYIAAHSGTGKLAYFKNLNLLEINDYITLIIKDKKYVYQINKIWEEQKNGYIHIQKDNTKQLILTTCSPNHKDKQLIINSTLKESS